MSWDANGEVVADFAGAGLPIADGTRALALD